jgi:hypothetical protein
MTIWFSAPAGTRIAIDVRDGLGTDGAPHNQGTAAFDLSNRALLASSGRIQGAAAEAEPGDWIKVSAQMSSSDGQMVVYIGLLGPNNSGIFSGTGERMIFGGVELSVAG